MTSSDWRAKTIVRERYNVKGLCITTTLRLNFANARGDVLSIQPPQIEVS